MKTRTPEHVDKGHPGVWPGCEPQSVRDAYDRLLEEQTTNHSRPSYTWEARR